MRRRQPGKAVIRQDNRIPAPCSHSLLNPSEYRVPPYWREIPRWSRVYCPSDCSIKSKRRNDHFYCRIRESTQRQSESQQTSAHSKDTLSLPHLFLFFNFNNILTYPPSEKQTLPQESKKASSAFHFSLAFLFFSFSFLK